MYVAIIDTRSHTHTTKETKKYLDTQQVAYNTIETYASSLSFFF